MPARKVPTHLKVVTGNPGKRPFNGREPKPVGALKEPPTWMSAEQKAGWAYAIQHAPDGLLKRLDRSVLTAWVIAEDLHRRATKHLRKGLTTKTPNGMVVQSPFLQIVNRQALVMLKAAAELGFTPASRSRIEIDYGDTPDDDEGEKPKSAARFFD